jgi:glycosyltransferase involved in cell wall biosynthesis
MPAETPGAPARVLILVPDLHCNGTARQSALLAAGLARRGATVRVCALGGPAPWADELRQAGVAVDLLGWTRRLDLAPFLELRRLLGTYRPEVIHAWGPLSLRCLVAVDRPRGCRVVASRMLTADKRPGWLDQHLLRRVDGVLALGATDAQRYHQLGIASVVEARPATDTEALLAPAPGTLPPPLPCLPDGARLLLGIGPLESVKGFYEAIWILDVLKLIYDNLHLALLGDGPERPRLERLVHNSRQTRCVHFLGTCADPGPVLERCELVWAAGRAGRGVSALLDVMAAGRPVLATRFPEISEVVRDGETGILVEPGSKPELTRGVYQLLEHPELRRRMGEMARRRVREEFGIGQLVEAGLRLYRGHSQADVAISA